MFDLNTRVDLDEVMPSHLIDQELSGTRIPVADALRQFDRVRKDRLAHLLRKVGRRCNLDDLLVATLNGAVTLKEMDGVAEGIRKELDLDMTRTLKESLNEDGAVAKGRLGLGHSSLKRVLEVGLLTDNTHTATAATHRGLDNDCGNESGDRILTRTR